MNDAQSPGGKHGRGTTLMIARATLGMLLGGVVVCGCRGGTAQDAQDTGKDALVGECRADAAERAGTAAADVSVETVEEVTWPDGSLGCPEPGMDYIQMLIPGYRIVVKAGGTTYEYHTDKRDRFVYCEDPTEAHPGYQPDGGGEAAPEPRGTGLLYLQPLENEPNGNSRLVRRELDGSDAETTVLDRCTDFAVSAAGSVLAKRRTSRQTHELVLARIGEEPQVVMQAFDFEALTPAPDSADWYFLAAPRLGEPFALYRAYGGTDARVMRWAPTAQRAHGASGAIAGNVLVVRLPGADGTEGRVLALNLARGEVTADVESAQGMPVPGE